MKTWLAAGALLISPFCLSAPEPTPKVALKNIDAYPLEIATRLLEQKANETSAFQKSDAVKENFLLISRRWEPGAKVLVAFNGGSAVLHRDVAAAASEWMKYANLKLDFGYNSKTRQYRQWSTTDKDRVAHIRIGFAAPGYWSALGTDSMIDNPFGPGSPSMNFTGFAQAWPNLKPARWKTVVQHEFGHALGFKHEHQQQQCFPEIRWQRGPNGEPDVYDVFLQWQGWERPVVDVNMRPVEAGGAALASSLDKASIFYYASPAQIYKLGTGSVCYLERENATISAEDARGAMLAYPKNPSHAITVAGLSVAEMQQVLANAGTLFSDSEKSAVILRMSSHKAAAQPLLYIHIQRETDRPLAKAIQVTGKEAGFMVPGIENVSKKGLKSGKIPQIRYFRDVDEAYAQDVARITSESTNAAKVEVLHIKHLAKTVSRNLVEVWLP